MTTPTTGSILDRAMLVVFTHKQWAATKHDKKVSDEVAATHNADTDAGRYVKRLVDKKRTATQTLVALNKIGTDARLFHYELTLPWLDNGTRILPSANYFKYVSGMADFEDKWHAALPIFVDAYPAIVNEASMSQNGLFNLADYPPAGSVSKKFTLGYRMLPMPAAQDFRVDMSADVVDQLRSEWQATEKLAADIRTRDIYSRISESVSHMATKLRGYTGGKEGSFRDSLVENVRGLVDLLPSLNIDGDPALTTLTERVKALTVFDADTLRASDNKRAETADAADAILKTVEEFMS